MLSFLRDFFGKVHAKSSSRDKAASCDADQRIEHWRAEVPARRLLKEATQLKKDKSYEAACRKLEEAFSAEGGDELMLKERMRLPMCLQLAGKSDEAWRIFNELNVTHVDVFSQAELANQMRIFLQKDKSYRQALLFEVWAICKELVRDKENVVQIYDNADMYASMEVDVSFGRKEPLGYTSKNNPIFDNALKMFEDRIMLTASPEGIEQRIASLVKKSNMSNSSAQIAKGVSSYLSSRKEYRLDEVRDLLETFD
ncbi:hypothetical protein ACFPTY_03475 [Halomonas beimenensis]|uniref:Uncharacterized protein n=1 Tax=Halomonas beimenensis TaxID=475662 RepID=A0A291P586_9GAMM|nr:hypothetical protein [Halomonas beimenensis]ATJ82022.1 hypothetical protein BEI_1035 [Halomonas beimenensis]